MSLIERFSEILEDSRRESLKITPGNFDISEEINCRRSFLTSGEAGRGSEGAEEPNIMALGDNAAFIKYLIEKKDMSGKINLIYIDPPFFSKAAYDAVINIKSSDGKKKCSVKYFAYDDIWRRDMTGYLKMLCQRLLLMKELLAEDGTIWVHLDWHAVHYVKIFMDEIFGEDNFVNEIIWHYKSGGSGKRHFSRKHDTILVYSKTKKYYFSPDKEKSYNRGFKPYRFKGVKEYKDDMGWYTMVTMKDVWNVDMVGRTSSERTGYATQKPEALLRRIIPAATKEGDICADFFCGSGTLAAVAQKMGRRWISCDGSPLAVSASVKRLQDGGFPICVMEDMSDKRSCLGEAQISFERKDITGSDKELVRISLDDYKLEGIKEKIDDKDREQFETAAEEYPLQFIEYWSVDFDFDGRVFRPEMIFSREKGTLTRVCEKLLPVSCPDRSICIKTVDVFGNYTMNVVKQKTSEQQNTENLQ